MKSSRREDKCGEVAGLSVARAIGIQGGPLPITLTKWLKLTSSSFGNSEKSKDRPKASRSGSAPGDNVSVGTPCTGISRTRRNDGTYRRNRY